MRVGRRTEGQTAAAQRGAFAPCAARQLAEARDAVRRCVALAERQLAERHAVRRCVARLAVRPSAARHAVRRCVVRAPRAVRALREGQALREARELQGRGARLALLLLAYAAVARLRLSPSQQKR
jgi:hypothetical protein